MGSRVDFGLSSIIPSSDDNQYATTANGMSDPQAVRDIGDTRFTDFGIGASKTFIPVSVIDCVVAEHARLLNRSAGFVHSKPTGFVEVHSVETCLLGQRESLSESDRFAVDVTFDHREFTGQENSFFRWRDQWR